MFYSFRGRLIIGALIFAGSVQAKPVRPFFQASRALAMGDAYTAVGTGFEAVYYNPAGIAKRNQPKMKLLDLEATTSQSFVGIFSSGYSTLLSLSSILEEVAKYPGKPFSLGVSLLPQFLIRNFSFGVLMRSSAEATYDESTTNTDIYSYADFGLYSHYGVALAGGVVKLGAGVKLLNRAEMDKTYTAAQVSAGDLAFTEQWQEGFGVGFDAGILMTLPTVGLPTLGVSIQDIGNTKFNEKRILFTSDSAPQGSPDPIKQKINTGFSFILKHGRDTRSVFAIDYKDVANIGSDYIDHLHAGWEININETVFLRAGVNEGRYWTAGFGLHMGGMGIEAGSYGENIADAGQDRISDRKYVGRYVLSF